MPTAPHDLLKLPPLLIGQPPRSDRLSQPTHLTLNSDHVPVEREADRHHHPGRQTARHQTRRTFVVSALASGRAGGPDRSPGPGGRDGAPAEAGDRSAICSAARWSRPCKREPASRLCRLRPRIRIGSRRAPAVPGAFLARLGELSAIGWPARPNTGAPRVKTGPGRWQASGVAVPDVDHPGDPAGAVAVVMTQQAIATARKTSAAIAGMPGRARTAAGSIPAAARPACRHLASFAKGTEVVVCACLATHVKCPAPYPRRYSFRSFLHKAHAPGVTSGE